jgi:uncharacterized 2Fe-2S/4Fe-4S cluster protein (DUF4445 family)
MDTAKVTFEPEGRIVHTRRGMTILEAARETGIHIEGPCGGKGLCGKCKVLVTGLTSELSAAERHYILKEEVEMGYRLACQTKVLSDVIVEVTWATKMLSQKILDHGETVEVKPEPDARQYVLKIPPPDLEDQRSDLQRLADVLPEGTRVSLNALRKLPSALRSDEFEVTATVVDGELVNVTGGKAEGKIFGVAFDIGTTTVVGYLMDLASGKQLSVSAEMNPQVIYGDDVITRIGYVIDNKDGLEKLHSKIVGCVNEIIEDLAEKAGTRADDVYEVSIVGNTCMHHLFAGIDPRNIAPIPFVPAVSMPLCIKAPDAGLRINPGAHVHLLPNISGYVGADIVGGILVSNLMGSDAVKLFIDIGTNGEIALSSGRQIVACSCAAGPAFEGARISSGMRAAIGAIDRAALEQDVSYTTINGGKPRGICGSGLVDIVAEMLRMGIVDSTGRIVSADETGLNTPGKIKNRISKGEFGNRFLIVAANDCDDGKSIYITQKDVRELQLAKAAIRTGMEILNRRLGISNGDIDEVLLAGAFGNYLRKESAMAIGLLPAVSLRKVRSVGNAAGEGAKLALISKPMRETAVKIARQVKYIELSADPEFTNEFANNLLFPEYHDIKEHIHA